MSFLTRRFSENYGAQHELWNVFETCQKSLDNGWIAGEVAMDFSLIRELMNEDLGACGLIESPLMSYG